MKNYSLITIVLLLLFSCNKSLDAVESEESIDSLSYYISRYKEAGTTLPLKRHALNKAQVFVNQLENDTTRNNYLKKFAVEYYRIKDTLAFLEISNDAIALSEKLKDSVGLARLYWDLGLYYQYQRFNSAKAYEHYFQAQKLYEELGEDLNSGKMLLNMAIIQTNVNDFIGSENTSVSALNKFEPLDAHKFLYSVYNNIGIVNNNLKDYDKAKYYYQKALESIEKIGGDAAYNSVCLNNLGVVLKDEQNYNEAIAVFEQAIKIDSLYYRNPIVYSALIDNIAYCNFKLGNNERNPLMFFRALTIRDSINYEPGIIESKLNLAEYYASKENIRRAIIFAEEARELAEKSNNREELLSSLLALSTLDTINSKRYSEQYISLADSLRIQERLVRNKFARIRYETDEYIDKNVELSEKIRNIIIASLVLLILLGLLYTIRSQRLQNMRLELERKQQAANEQIYNLMIDQQNKITEGRKREKKRISAELHDGVLGSLFGTRLSLGSLNTKNDESAIQNRQAYIERLKEIEEEIRSISHNLQSKVLREEQIFSSLIEELMEIQSQASNFSYIINYDKKFDWDLVDSKLKINIYRIIQESIQNINKYAKASDVFLTFKTLDKDHILIKIEDNGIGFNVNKKSKGIGLSNIESRTKEIKGKLKISSRINKGTIIELSIPKQLYYDKKTA